MISFFGRVGAANKPADQVDQCRCVVLFAYHHSRNREGGVHQPVDYIPSPLPTALRKSKILLAQAKKIRDI